MSALTDLLGRLYYAGYRHEDVWLPDFEAEVRSLVELDHAGQESRPDDPAVAGSGGTP